MNSNQMLFCRHELSLPIITIEILFCYPINILIFIQTLFFKYKIIKKHALLFSSLSHCHYILFQYIFVIFISLFLHFFFLSNIFLLEIFTKIT